MNKWLLGLLAVLALGGLWLFWRSRSVPTAPGMAQPSDPLGKAYSFLTGVTPGTAPALGPSIVARSGRGHF
jgi:hypothetical protein